MAIVFNNEQDKMTVEPSWEKLMEQAAEICLKNVVDTTGSENRGLLKGDSIYIIRTSKVPVALIEVGFMTNYKELDLLNSTSYQKKAAEGIYNAINEAFQEGY